MQQIGEENHASGTMATVLIVDDDPKLLKMLQRTLTYEGFRVLSATNGHEALAEVQAHRPDVVVLDWLMPGLDGLGVLERLRAAGDKTLVLMLTARDAVEHRVEGLESGADDYLVKPFAPAELLARIHALLRRPAVAAAHETLAFANLTLDPATRETQRGDRSFDLTTKEFDLLRFLLRHPRQVLSREQILQEVWGYDFGGEDNVLEVYIGYLRKKTEAGGESRLIQTVRGVGYVLREET
jgi:two-component system response regulator MprA